MKHILITGEADFIGSNFIHYAMDKLTDIHITNIDALTYVENPENLSDLELNSRYKFIHGDINNSQLLENFFQKNAIDHVIHFMVKSHVDRFVTNPHSTFKAADDHLVRSHFLTYGLLAIITNCSNNYSGYQYPEKLIPLIISNAVIGKPLPIDGDGKQIRDWLYVQDHCKALNTILQKDIPGEPYNIGGGNQPTSLEIVRMICKIPDELLLGSEFIPHANFFDFVKDRPVHDRRYAMNATKISRELGWQPMESLESGLRKTIKWYLDNNDWINSTLGKNPHRNWQEGSYEVY
ncbi:MAG: dTDP-glucose 4,6-dehydratase [Candidatus Helarchaeales archaeon]